MPAWNVVVSQHFLDALEEIGPPGYDWTAAIAGVRWYLGHDPLAVGHGTQDSQVRIYLQDRPSGLPGFKVFYVIEERTVTLLSARPFVPDIS
jgi:hypothetical protein